MIALRTFRRAAIAASLLSMAAAGGADRPALAAPPPSPGAAHADAAAEDISLAVGETKVISARDVKNYSEGAGDIIDVKLTSDNSQFVVVGKRAGSTTLVLIRNDGTTTTISVNVFPKSPVTVERELVQLLEGMPGVRVRRIGARFFLEGGVGSENDVKKVAQIAALYPGQVESLVAVGTGAEERKILVRVDFYFAQYDKDSSFGVGVGWPASVGGDGILQSNLAYDFVAKTATSATATIVNQPLPRLDIAARHGWAKVFKQATVITRNGSEATFESGGEQNFSVNTGLTIGVQRIQFGANVNVQPAFDPQTRELDVKLDANVSDLTAPVASNLPGRTTSRLITTVHMKLGQSLVLSGIHTMGQTHDVSGVPVLSDIPVLGLLFASHKNTETETEGAIFIVPTIVDAVSKPASDMIDGALSQYEKYKGDFDVLDLSGQKPNTAGASAPAAPRPNGAR